MAVYKNFRKNVASKIASIEDTETFLWNKWLRIPTSEDWEIKPLKSKLRSTESIVLSMDIPSNSNIEAKIPKVKNLRASPRMYKMKSKSHPIFFGFGTSRPINIDISFYQELKQYFSTVVEEDGSSIYFLIEDIKNKKTKKQLNPNTKNIPVAVVLRKEYGPTENMEYAVINFTFKENKTLKVDSDIRLRDTVKVNTDFQLSNTVDINYRFNTPEIIDQLSRIKPKVYDIALLNNFNDLNLKGKDFQVKIDLLDNAPSISEKTVTQLKDVPVIKPQFKNEIKFELNKSNFANLISISGASVKKASSVEMNTKGKIVFSIKYDYETSLNPVSEIKSSASIIDPVNKILQPEINLNEDELTELFKNLYPYQKEGVEFLTGNHRAYLYDELGLGKTVQAITAIKLLLKKREIKTALIIAQDYYTGDAAFNSKINGSNGWEGQIKQFAADVPSMVLNSNILGTVKGLEQSAQIFIIPYSIFSQDTHNEILKSNKFKNIDCICFDDAEIFTSSYNRFEKLIKSTGAKYLWILSNSQDDQFYQKISAEFNFKAALGRSKEQVNSQLPSLMRQDYWCELDKKQFSEYDQSLFQVKSQIDDVLSTGNPYRLQAKVFTLLHQLKQITNFYSEEISSNKAKLLITHLDSMIKYGSKAVIFSQYDKFGTQKLIELFKQKNIPFISYSPSMALNEIEKSVKKFGSDKSIKVFLINTQADITNIKFGGINYIIHFDQWWIPTKQWQLEDKVTNNNTNKSAVHVISYLTKNTIDEKLNLKLLDKYLLTKNLIDTLGAITFSKLFSENDWLDIFDFPKDKKYHEEPLSAYIDKIQALSPELIIDKIVHLFSNLGYKYIEKSEIEKKKHYLIKGSFEKDKQTIEFDAHCFPTNKKLDQSIINNILNEIKEKSNLKRIFIVALSPVDYSKIFSVPENTTFMNLDLIAKYFQMLRII